MSKSLIPVSLAAAVAGAAVLGWISPAHADGDACTTTDFKYDKVKNACASGGRPAAKALMKETLKKAKAAGKADWTCTTCHEDQKTFKLKANAVDDIKPFI